MDPYKQIIQDVIGVSIFFVLVFLPIASVMLALFILNALTH